MTRSTHCRSPIQTSPPQKKVPKSSQPAISIWISIQRLMSRKMRFIDSSPVHALNFPLSYICLPCTRHWFPSRDRIKKILLLHHWLCKHLTFTTSLPWRSFAISSCAGGCWVKSYRSYRQVRAIDDLVHLMQPNQFKDWAGNCREAAQTSGGKTFSAARRGTENPPCVLVSLAVNVLQK